MDQSKKGTLNTTDWKQIGIKLAMVVAAVAATELARILGGIDFGQYQTYITGVIFILQYIGQRALTGTSR